LLKPGRYALVAELKKDGFVIGKRTEDITVRAFRAPEFPVGVGGGTAFAQPELEYLEKNHISFVTGNGPPDNFLGILDRFYRHGITCYPNLNIVSVWQPGIAVNAAKEEPYFIYDTASQRWLVNPEQVLYYLQTLVPIGKETKDGGTSSGSPFSDIAFGMMEKVMNIYMDQAGDHPGWQYVSFQDETYLRYVIRDGVVWLGDYSYPAVEHFEKMTGMKGPVWPPDTKPGTVFPDDEPYLKWINTIGVVSDFTCEGFDRLYEKLAGVIKQRRPDIKAVNYSGGEYGYLDAVGDWQYPYIWEPGLAYTHSGLGMLDYSFDRHRSRQKDGVQKPLWALLGWWSGDMTQANIDTPWWTANFRQNTVLALAKGVKLLEWFTVGNFGRDGFLSVPEGRAEFERWTQWLHQYGPLFNHLEPPKNIDAVAFHFSETNTAGKTAKNPKMHPNYDIIYTAARIAGAEPFILTDETIMKGELNSAQALFLIANDYSYESLWKKITGFSETEGKTVFHDTSTNLFPEKSKALGFNFRERGPNTDGRSPRDYLKGLAWQARQLREILPKEMLSTRHTLSGSDYIAPYWLDGGDARYLFLINYHWEQTEKSSVKMDNPYGEDAVVYNLLTGKKASFEETVSLDAGEWAVFAILPREIGSIDVEVLGGRINTSIYARLLDKNGKTLDVPVPLSVKIFDPDGNLLPYTQPTAMNNSGIWKANICFSPLMDAKGEYRIELKELLSGAETKSSFNLK